MAPKRLTREEQVYEELRKAMDGVAFRAPRTPSLMKMLRFFFPTFEDADIARCLGSAPGQLKTAAEVAGESGYDIEKVKKVLERLSVRLGVGKRERPGEPGVMEYALTGTWTMIDVMGTLGKDDSVDPPGITYKEVMNRYWDEGYSMEWGPSEYPAFRTLVVDKPIDAEAKVLPYEIACEIIKANKSIAIGWCACRVRNRRCNHRIDCCFLFGFNADHIVQLSKEIPGARSINYVSQEEALQILDEGFKEGLVASTMNNTDPAQAIFLCMCCSCCCNILNGYTRNITGWGNPYQTMKSNFQPRVDDTKCRSGCKICVELCPVKARWRHWPHKPDLSDDFIFLEGERCIGCGICAYNCPNDALSMVRVSNVVPEPDLISQWSRVDREARH